MFKMIYFKQICSIVTVVNYGVIDNIYSSTRHFTFERNTMSLTNTEHNLYLVIGSMDNGTRQKYFAQLKYN